MENKNKEKKLKTCPCCGGSGRKSFPVMCGRIPIIQTRMCHYCNGTGRVEE